MLEPIFAQGPDAEAVIAFVFTTIVFLTCALIALTKAARDDKLIIVGIVTAVAALAYTSLVAGSAVVMAPTLMRIAFLLVLGGVATRLLAIVPAGGDRRETPAKEQTND